MQSKLTLYPFQANMHFSYDRRATDPYSRLPIDTTASTTAAVAAAAAAAANHEIINNNGTAAAATTTTDPVSH